MVYLIAGVLLGAAVAILTLPWSRRDPADFSPVELGYAARGPRGAILGALRVLMDRGVMRRSRQHGVVRTDEALPRDIAPLARAVHAGLDTPRSPSELLDLRSVEDELQPTAERVLGAGLRVGPARRAIGSLATLAAPMTSVVALAHSVGNVATGIAVTVVTVLGSCWLVALRGLTVRGARTLAAAPRRRGGARRRGTGRRGGLLMNTNSSLVLGVGAWAEMPGGFAGGSGGGFGGSGGGGGDSSGGGGDFGGDGGGGGGGGGD